MLRDCRSHCCALLVRYLGKIESSTLTSLLCCRSTGQLGVWIRAVAAGLSIRSLGAAYTLTAARRPLIAQLSAHRIGIEA